MNETSLDDLLPLLRDGDPKAIETLFLNVAPALRSLVRRKITGALRTKFDSKDVVLSAWTACHVRTVGSGQALGHLAVVKAGDDFDQLARPPCR